MFQKNATTSVPIHELLAKRWSPRALDPDRDLDGRQLTALLEAARWAPSCFGAQPWRMLVCPRRADKEAWQGVLECLAAGNQEWAKDAPLFLVATADGLFEHNQEPNRWGQYDTGAAAENICLQATSMGLMVHQMGGFDQDKIRLNFAIPERYTPMAVVAVGFQLPEEDIPQAWRDREYAPRERNPLDENFFFGRWGAPISTHMK